MRVKPFLKWAGNKYRTLTPILSSLSPAMRLIEPFTGSAAIFMNTDYPAYTLAEKNTHLVNLYRMIQTEGATFIESCAPWFSLEYNTPEQYYSLRQLFNETQDNHLKAMLFLYLNRHGYNGLCRYNLKGGYNVPFGRYKKPYFPRTELYHFYEKSKNATFIAEDFRATFQLAERGDIIYCDPPYVPLSASASFTAYTAGRFDEQDQIALATLAIDAANRGITVLISNHDTPLTRHYYQQSDIQSFMVSRSISCNKFNRKPVKEILAIFRSQ